VWCRNDSGTVGTRAHTVTELPAERLGALRHVQPPSVTADCDDQPLTVVDMLNSSPAVLVEIINSPQQQQRPSYYDRSISVCQCVNVMYKKTFDVLHASVRCEQRRLQMLSEGVLTIGQI